MKKGILLLTLTLLASGQGFGMALCPSACDMSQGQTTDISDSPCHKKENTDNSSDKAPFNCEVADLLIDIAAEDVFASVADNFADNVKEKPFAMNTFSQLSFRIDFSKSYRISLQKPMWRANTPVYLLNQIFLI